MQTIVDIREAKSMEKKVDSELSPDTEHSKSLGVQCDNNISGTDDEKPAITTKAVSNSTVHIQHSHFPSNVVQTTNVLPRPSSEQSKLRILTRTPAVQCLSSPPSEESEDLPPDSEQHGVKHQTSKDGSESGPPSLSSSRDSSFDYTDSTGTDLYEFIVKTLKNPRDKKMLLKLEKDFLAFIMDNRKVFLQYPPMTSYHRMIVHRVAAYFGLDHNVDPTGTCIIVNKCPSTRLPEDRFSELIREDSEEDPLPKLILRRQDSLMDETVAPEKNSTHSRRTLEDKKSKSIEEREEEYVKARARIFNHGSLSSQSSASSKEGEASFFGPRDTSIDDENELVTEDNGDKPGALQPAVKVLTKSSRSLDMASSKLTQDVGATNQTSSSACSTTVTTTVTDSKFDKNLPIDTSDVATVSVEGVPLLAGNLPLDVACRPKMVGPTGMVPYLSPNQTGGVVWTLPENQVTYPPGHASLFPGPGSGSQIVAPDNFQTTPPPPPPAAGMKPGHGNLPGYFYSTKQGYQTPRQPSPSQQQTQGSFPGQGLPMTTPYGSPSTFPLYQTPRMFGQQDLVPQEIVSQQQAGTISPGSGHTMAVPNAGNISSNYQDISNQLAGISLSQLEQQENQMFQNQRQPGSNYSPSVTQTFPAGQPVQYVVYRHSTGAMVAHPIHSQGQATSGYLYSSPNHQAYTQPSFNPQVYNPQVFSQQSFNQPYSGDQTMLAHRAGTHTPPTPPQSGSSMGTSAPFMPHLPTMPGSSSRQQFPTPINNPLPQVPTRLVSPYPMQGQQLVPMPGAQQMYSYSQPYTVGQTRTGVQQPPRFKPYVEQGHVKPVDIYSPDNQRRPSPSGSPRANVSASNQSRRASGGVSGKTHGKNEGQRSQNQQSKGKQRHKRSQHKNADPSRKQSNVGASSAETVQTTGLGSCVLEIYDIASNARDVNHIFRDLRQSGAQIIWNENFSQSAGDLTAKATFNSPSQAEQALKTNSNPNYKLRRCSAETSVTKSLSY